MKKLFTSLFLLTLIVSLLCSAPVKAETISFAIPNNGWYWGNQTDDCAGNFNDKNVVNQGAFVWSGGHDEAVKRIDDTWTGVNSGSKCCTRNTVPLNAATYTITLVTKRLSDNVTMTLPVITIHEGTASPHYASTAKWDKDDVLQTEDVSSTHQFYYTDASDKKSRDKEVTLTYTNVVVGTAGNYQISIEFPSGDKDKYLMKTLTITQDGPAAPTYAVSVTASNGEVTGTGTFAAGATVTLTPSADPDYSFSGWSDASGISISGQEKENPLIFTMPSNAVSLTANFTACTKHTVTLTAGANGSVSGGGEFCEGSVTVTATPNSGYRFVNWTNTSTSDVVSTDAEYTFNLSADISLTANFEYNPCTDTKLIEAEDYINGYSAYHFPNGAPKITEDASASNGKYFEFNGNDEYKDGEINYYVYLPAATYSVEIKHRNGKDKYLNIYAEDPNGDVTYNTVKYKKMNAYNPNLGDDWCEDWKTFELDNVEITTGGYYLIGLYGKQYAMFDYVKFTANTGVFCSRTITMEKSGDASAEDPTSSPANTAMAGTVVTVTAGAPSDANHYFVNWTASPSVEFVNANVSSTTFVMPAEDVTITANYGAVVSSEFTYSASGEGTITCATASGSSVVSGTEIEMTAAVTGAGYVFRGWTATAGTFSDAAALTTTFTMPAEAATVTATFAQVDNIISMGSETGSESYHSGATMTESHIDDFGTFGHVVLMLSYSDMTGGNYHGWNIGKNSLYNSANSAGATGFGFYYKTETDEDKVAFCFDHGSQYKVELPATNNVWKYHYIATDNANGWNGSNIIIYINGTDGGNTTANANGAIYLADIAATSITSKPEIASYIYTRDISGAGYGTLCLPMAGTVEGATLFSVAGKQEENSKLYVVLQEEPDLVGGQPYIFEKTADELRATMSGPHSAVNEEANGLVGTYAQITAPAYSEPDHHNYVLALDESNNTVFKKVGENVTVGAYRAYMNLDGVPAYNPSQAIPGRRYVMMGVSGTQETEDTEDISAVEEVESGKVLSGKILVNGQLYLMYEGKMYNVRGARVK